MGPERLAPELNFSWIIRDKLAGCGGPTRVQDLVELKALGVGAIVRLERRTISGEGAGLVDLAEYVPDGFPPTPSQIDRLMAFVDDQLEHGVAVAISCKVGVGRTGTVLACYLVHTGFTPGEAIIEVRQLRPGSIESPPQEVAVHLYGERTNAQRS